MLSAHTVNAVRAAEHALMERVPDGTLMRRAAAGLAVECTRLLPRVYGSRVVLMVGGGDNGGDALYAGAALAARGAAVHALLAGGGVHEGGAAALRAAGGRIRWFTDAMADEADLFDADLIVDGLLGIGGRGGLRAPHAALALLAENAPVPVVAVDLPSGVDADTGEVAGHAVRADVTVTFGTHKPGLFVDPGSERAGRIRLVDIGLSPELPGPDAVCPRAADVASLLPTHGAEADKYGRGVLAVRAGSDRYPGAAVLCVGGALRAGVGMVRYGGGAAVVGQVLSRWPETVASLLDPQSSTDLSPGRAAAVVIGSGRGTHRANADELRAVLDSDCPVLVDADGLTLLTGQGSGPLVELLRERTAHTLLTPHAGELARLLEADRGDVEARRLEHAARARDHFGCTVLLKGSTTVIAHPGAPVVVNPTGTPLLATAGTGDVLSGAVGAFMAAGLPAREAAMCGAYVHGRAAVLVRGGAPISASDLWDGLPLAMGEVARAA
ncbi:bifunctional ADP-dependent NAD(P)H-hydrate dehydratase/NAD(P)H-hydrate epimerase [Nocardiopsis halotolerans]|uniref:bifunctional ADP-dependent NAD(P)H-hydrate dehydratase/NAD(P)H-hydrate epimerase n=1 Tax=Nocardiopsis halotolerans TaxID=124252 RepID=UPI00034867CC|nr:bifunctional ADP-dependent NAD(P)H-hydrate dehydratase/NAD(P)H-hydrate epimerase [Nocardiopsis halotolerans]